jgi:hypothetical protein
MSVGAAFATFADAGNNAAIKLEVKMNFAT